MIRDARLAERDQLIALQRRASMHSGAYRDDLVAHPDAIDIPASQFERGLVRVAEREGELVGFHVLLEARDGACALDGLFVEPSHWLAGTGRLLVEDAVAIAAPPRERHRSRRQPRRDPFLRARGIRPGRRRDDALRCGAPHAQARAAASKRPARVGRVVPDASARARE